MKPKTHQATQSLRIIGGQFKGRKFNFPDIPGLRPTPDRVRETLFNWLQFDINGMSCLDLFAGSGALGLEALSRGAKEVTFVDLSKEASNHINAVVETLDLQNAHVYQTDAFAFTKEHQTPKDLIFIDPPFNQGLVEKTLAALLSSQLVNNNTLFYIETETPWTSPGPFSIFKSTKAGLVHAYLLEQQQA